MSRELTPRTTLDGLRKEAKRWLKAVEAGDTEAQARFSAAMPGRSAPGLREIQLALARVFGFQSWAELRQEIEDRSISSRNHAERLEDFLTHSVIRYGTPPGSGTWNPTYEDTPSRWAWAGRILAKHPGIATENIHTAAVAGDVDAVQRFLAKDAGLANQPHPLDGWPPLLRLASTRLPTEAARANGIAIARLLLDHAADPKAYWADKDDNFHFTVVTCAIGHGEGSQPEHPQAVELVRLLLDRGAEPFDGQALYNTSLGPDETFWLDFLHAESEKRGEANKWLTKPRELHTAAVNYLLGNAVNQRHAKRIAWLLNHGADANTANAYSRAPVMKHALLSGDTGIADMLSQHGAQSPPLSGEEAFQAAVMRGDIAEAKRLAGANANYLLHPGPMLQAVEQHRIDLVEALLDLGMSPDVHGPNGMRPLHQAAGSGALDIAKLLIARGAEIDPFENRFGGTPLSWANHGSQQALIDLIAPLSRNIRGLCFAAALGRLRELLTENPALASEPIRPMEPPLFCLPDDPEAAVEVAELLLSFGADANVRNAEGLTPADAARRQGLDEAAGLLSG